MPKPSVRYIEDLSSRDTEKLTQLLTLGWRSSPNIQWLSEQEQVVAQLPSSLRKPEGFLPRLANYFPGTLEKAHLCSAHKGLNTYLIRRLFFQLSSECTTRLTRLNENLHLPENLVRFLERIHGTNSLWLSPSYYRSIFKVSPNQVLPERVVGECEACILCVVGANHQMLSDLRASMLGRRKKGLPVPRLLKIVEAWIDGSGSFAAAAIRKQSDALEKEIRGCRKQMQKARRQKRRNIKDGIIDQEIPDDKEPLLKDTHEEAGPDEVFEMEGKEKDENAEHYFETSILDYYASQSRTNLAFEDIHPAFRESMMAFYPNTGTFHRRDVPPSPPPRSVASTHWPVRQPSPPPPTAPPTTYTSSVYSRSGQSYGQTSTTDLPSIPSTEERARAYRNLMGTGTEDEGTERRRTQESRLSADRVTRWMDFQ